MKEFSFRHPDFCPVVTARRITLEILELVEGVGRFVASGGRSLAWSSAFPSRAAYYSAMWRLKKAGLVAARREGNWLHYRLLCPCVLEFTDCIAGLKK